jgi:hypothetical protein
MFLMDGLFLGGNFSQLVDIEGEVNPTWDFLEKNTNNLAFEFNSAFMYISPKLNNGSCHLGLINVGDFA